MEYLQDTSQAPHVWQLDTTFENLSLISLLPNLFSKVAIAILSLPRLSRYGNYTGYARTGIDMLESFDFLSGINLHIEHRLQASMSRL
jgi:hypothetical protein